MITALVLVWEAKMCWAAEILMVRENCVAFIFVWSVDAGTFCMDAECYATSFNLNWCYIYWRLSADDKDDWSDDKDDWRPWVTTWWRPLDDPSDDTWSPFNDSSDDTWRHFHDPCDDTWRHFNDPSWRPGNDRKLSDVNWRHETISDDCIWRFLSPKSKVDCLARL